MFSISIYSMALLLQAPSVYGTQCLVLVYIHMALLLQAPSVYGTQCLVLVYICMALLLQAPSVYGTQCLVLVYIHMALLLQAPSVYGTQCLVTHTAIWLGSDKTTSNTTHLSASNLHRTLIYIPANIVNPACVCTNSFSIRGRGSMRTLPCSKRHGGTHSLTGMVHEI